MGRLRVALSILGVLLVGIAVALLIWSRVSEEGIADDVRDVLTFDAEDAGEFAEQYGQARRRPGERLRMWGCGASRYRGEEIESYRCRVLFDSGRRLRFSLEPTENRGFRVVEALRSN